MKWSPVTWEPNLSAGFLLFGGVGFGHHFLLPPSLALQFGWGASVAEKVLGEVSHLMFNRLSLLCCPNLGALSGAPGGSFRDYLFIYLDKHVLFGWSVRLRRSHRIVKGFRCRMGVAPRPQRRRICWRRPLA